MEINIQDLVDVKYGIIKELINMVRYPTEPKIWAYTVLGSICNKIGEITGAGVSRLEAQTKAIENYISLYCDKEIDSVAKKPDGELITSNGIEKNISYASMNKTGSRQGVGCSISSERAIELAIIDALEKSTLEKLKEGQVKLELIDVEKNRELKGFYLKYINYEFKPQLYMVRDSVIPIVIGSIKMIDGTVFTKVKVEKDIFTACKGAYIKLGESHIRYSNLDENDKDDLYYTNINGMLTENENLLKSMCVGMKKNSELSSEVNLLEEIFKNNICNEIYKYNINNYIVDNMGYHVVKVFMK